MKIQFLDTSINGLKWMKNYFMSQPQLDAQTASKNYQNAKRLLKEQPYIGHPFGAYDDVLEFSIKKTAFSFLYTVQRDTIFIIDIRDSRGMRSAKALRQFNDELKSKYGF